MIGEGDAVADRPYSYTVLCRSLQGEVFEIKKEVRAAIHNKHTGFFNQVEEKWRNMVANNEQVH